MNIRQHGLYLTNAGKPAYSNHYDTWAIRLCNGQLTLSIVRQALSFPCKRFRVVHRADGARVECDQSHGSCKAGIASGGTVTSLPSRPGTRELAGCTPGIDPNMYRHSRYSERRLGQLLRHPGEGHLRPPVPHHQRQRRHRRQDQPRRGLKSPRARARRSSSSPTPVQSPELLVDGSPVTECDDEIDMLDSLTSTLCQRHRATRSASASSRPSCPRRPTTSRRARAAEEGSAPRACR
jgi:hypothetical protein